MLQGIWFDLRFAMRNLRRQPAFTSLVVAAIALGVGAAVAIFSVLWSVALRPLPWPDPDELVSFSEVRPGMPGGGPQTGAFLLNNVREFQDQARSFDGIAAYMTASFALTDREEPVPIQAMRVTPDLFRILRTGAARGRVFEREEVEAGSENLVVLSNTAFARYFANDEAKIGGSIELDGAPYTLLGVLPPDVYFPDPSIEAYVPIVFQGTTTNGGQTVEREMLLPVVARLAEGVTLAQAEAEGGILLEELTRQRSERRAQRAAEGMTRRTAGGPGPGPDSDSGAGDGERVVRRVVQRGGDSDGAGDGAPGEDGRTVRRVVSAGSPGDAEPDGGAEGERVVRRVVRGGEPTADGETGERRVVHRVVGDDADSEQGPGGVDVDIDVAAAGPGPGGPDGAGGESGGERRVVVGGPAGPTEEPEVRFELATLLDQQIEPARPALRMLIGAVGLMLLIACANVANLLLTRGIQRRRELATRAALGAGRVGLGRLLFIESLVLSILGAGAGLAFAWAAIRLVRRFDPGDLPRLADIALEPTVVLFALLLMVVSSVVFGLVPALQTSLGKLTQSLGRDGTRVGSGSGWLGNVSMQGLLRSTLAVTEVALALVLLIGAGLLARSFYELSQEDPGYEPAGVLTAAVAPPPSRYPAGEARNAFFRNLLERLEETPGVESAAAANFLPLFQGRIVLSTMIEGQAPPSDPRDAPQADLRVVTDDYFEAMGIDVVEGRAFDGTDRSGAAQSVIVNQSFADRYLEAGRAVGTRLAGFGEIVGVAGDVRAQGLDTEPAPMFYLPLEQAPAMMSEIFSRMYLAVRGNDPETLAPAVRTALQSLDASVALEDVRTMEDRLSESVAQPRFYALILTVSPPWHFFSRSWVSTA